MQQPPPDMAGKARQLNADECTTEDVPDGTWLIKLVKKEIDMAAQVCANAPVVLRLLAMSGGVAGPVCGVWVRWLRADKKHAKFDETFSIEVLFAPLEGKFGTGPAFDDIKSKGGDKKRVLYLEKE
eukprot:2953665-Rhodomonas_salina.1